MKKSIAVMLIFAVLSNMFISVFADDGIAGIDIEDNLINVQPIFSGGDKKIRNVYNDINYAIPSFVSEIEDANLRKKAEVLTELGIIFDNVEISETVARDEFVSWVVKLVNLYCHEIEKSSYFSDINADNGYLKYIEAAAENGIISGDNGFFYPKNSISYNECISVIAKALGFKVYAELNGGYPMGYIMAAKKSGISTRNMVSDDPVDFFEAVEMLYSALTAEVMFPVGYSADEISYLQKENVLEYYHDIYVVAGRVDANCIVSLNSDISVDSTTITIDGISYRTMEEMMYDNFIGCEVEAYVKESAEKDTVVCIVKDERTKEIKINASDIDRFSDFTYYYGDSKQKKVSKNHNLIINGVKAAEYTEEDFVPESGEVILVSSGNGDADMVFVNEFKAFPFVEAVGTGEQEVIFKSLSSDAFFTLDLGKEDRIVEFYLDGKKFDFNISYDIVQDADGEDYRQYKLPNIPGNSVLNIFADKYARINKMFVPAEDAKVVKVYVTTKAVDGTLDVIRDDELVINNSKYELSKTNLIWLAKKELKAGVKGKFLFDYEGNITAWIPEIVNSGYGYLINAACEDLGIGDYRLSLKLMNEQGDIGTYKCRDKIRINGEMQNDLKYVYDLLKASAALSRNDGSISQVISFETDENNEVSKLNIMESSVGKNKKENCITRNCERQSLMSRHENGNSLYSETGLVLYNSGCNLIFSVPEAFSSNDDDYYVMTNWGEDRLARNTEVYDCDYDLIPGLVVTYRGAEQEMDRPYFMVDYVAEEVDEEGNMVSVMYGTDGVYNNQAVYKAETVGLFDGLKRGDFILLYGINDTVTRYDMLMPIDTVKSFDFSKSVRPDSTFTDLFELYSVYDNRFLIVQRGNLGKYGVREYQQCNSADPYGENHFLYDESSGSEPKISYFYNPEALDTVLNDGVEKASKILIYTSGTYSKYVVAYKGI